MTWLLALTTGAIFGVGVYLLLQRDAIKLILGFSLVLGAANLFLLGCSTFRGGEAPYVETAANAVDPLPQALVLTAIVIGFGVLSLLAALVLAVAWKLRSLDLDNVSRLRR
ncbi:sodium:proton antiporter [Vulgatibacter sp.]|uniref:sodium:proton antiporter n=1 Tax=Vulgatibacter sp. TaxID=1971226 RepID=UPI003565E445